MSEYLLTDRDRAAITAACRQFYNGYTPKIVAVDEAIYLAGKQAGMPAWIPVGERLPEAPGWVLGFCHVTEDHTNKIICPVRYYDSHKRWVGEYEIPVFVTHWMTFNSLWPPQ